MSTYVDIRTTYVDQTYLPLVRNFFSLCEATNQYRSAGRSVLVDAQTTIGSEYLPIVLHLRGAINIRLAYRCECIEREDKGAPQSGASCRGNRLRLVATSLICPRLLRWLSCRFLWIRLEETEIRCIFASEIFRESSREVNGSVAQLNRASDYGSEGYRFESCRSH